MSKKQLIIYLREVRLVVYCKTSHFREDIYIRDFSGLKNLQKLQQICYIMSIKLSDNNNLNISRFNIPETCTSSF